MQGERSINNMEVKVQKVRKGPSQADLVKEASFRAAGPCIDIGLNLKDKSFDNDRREVLERAKGAGLVACVLTGTSVHSSSASRDLADSDLSDTLPLFFTAGVHPHDAKTCNQETIGQLRDLASDPKCVSVGECGLDFNRMFSPQDVQIEWFGKQVELAKELKKPLFLHCRDAADEFIQVLEAHMPLDIPVVVHCFTGNELELRRFVDLGLFIGVTGWITDERPERGGFEVARLLPLIPKDKLMIETDAPYIVPRSIKGSKRPGRNEPALLPHVLRAVAEALGENEDDVARRTTANAIRFFSLPSDLAETFRS